MHIPFDLNLSFASFLGAQKYDNPPLFVTVPTEPMQPLPKFRFTLCDVLYLAVLVQPELRDLSSLCYRTDIQMTIKMYLYMVCQG